MSIQMMFINGFTSFYPHDKITISCKLGVTYITIEKLCKVTVIVKGKTAYVTVEQFTAPDIYTLYTGKTRELGYLNHAIKHVLIRYRKEFEIEKIVFNTDSPIYKEKNKIEVGIDTELKTKSEEYAYLNLLDLKEVIGVNPAYFPPKIVFDNPSMFIDPHLTNIESGYLPNFRILLDHYKRTNKRLELLYVIRNLEMKDERIIKTDALLDYYGEVTKTVNGVDFVDVNLCTEGLRLFRHFDYHIIDHFKVLEYDLFNLIVDYKDLPYSFLQKYDKKFKSRLATLLLNPDCPIEYIKDHIDDIKKLDIVNEIQQVNPYIDKELKKMMCTKTERLNKILNSFISKFNRK